jgi:hypothetical protein
MAMPCTEDSSAISTYSRRDGRPLDGARAGATIILSPTAGSSTQTALVTPEILAVRLAGWMLSSRATLMMSGVACEPGPRLIFHAPPRPSAT